MPAESGPIPMLVHATRGPSPHARRRWREKAKLYYIGRVFRRHAFRRRHRHKEANTVLPIQMVLFGKEGWLHDAKHAKKEAWTRWREFATQPRKEGE